MGLDKADVLWALYNYALFSGPNYEFNSPLSILVRSRPLSSRQAAVIALMDAAQRGDYYFESIDLGQGLRPLYVDLSGYEIDVAEYDSHHGTFHYYAYKIIQHMRLGLARLSFLSQIHDDVATHDQELSNKALS